MLEVLDGGLRTTVQDTGRRGGQALGIPPSGAQDGFALRIANLLAGNPAGGPLVVREDPGAAGLEITLGRLKLRALADHAVALAGADTGATVDGEAVPCWSSFVLRRGRTLACGMAKSGARAYLAGPWRDRRAALPGQPRHPCERRLRRAGGAGARPRRPAAGRCGIAAGGRGRRAPAAARPGAHVCAAPSGARRRRPRRASLHGRQRRGLLRDRLETQPEGRPDGDALHRPRALLQAGTAALPDRGRGRRPLQHRHRPRRTRRHRAGAVRASSRSCSGSIRPASAAMRGSPS